MQQVNAAESIGVSGFVAETADLRQMPWSDRILDKEPLDVEIGVTHYKAPGGAWGQFVVLVLVREGGAGEMASARARLRF
jgi:hypothetical protein